jgi:hypothetical protein
MTLLIRYILMSLPLQHPVPESRLFCSGICEPLTRASAIRSDYGEKLRQYMQTQVAVPRVATEPHDIAM